MKPGEQILLQDILRRQGKVEERTYRLQYLGAGIAIFEIIQIMVILKEVLPL